jgi:hypothetical protein
MNARCDGQKCKELLDQTPEEAMKCTVPQTMVEEIGDEDCKRSRATELAKADRDIGLETLPGGVMPH